MKLHRRWVFSLSVILINLCPSIGAVSDAQAALITRLHYYAELDVVDATVPGVVLGTPVSGSFVFDWHESSNEYTPVTEFTLSVGGQEFTQDDVKSSAVMHWTSTGGITATVELFGRPDFGDWSDGLTLELFQEFGDSNLFLFSPTASGRAGIDLEPLAIPPAGQVPLPSAFWLLASGFGVVWSARRGGARTRSAG